MSVTSKKILDANVLTCAVAGTAEEVSSFIQAVDGKISKIVNGTQEILPSGGIADVSALFTSANTSLMGVVRYDHVTYTSGKLTDRAINSFTMTGNVTVQFPDAVTGKARDLLLLVTHTSGELTLPTGNTYYGDVPTMDANATYLIALTEVSSGVWYMRTIKMEVTTG